MAVYLKWNFSLDETSWNVPDPIFIDCPKVVRVVLPLMHSKIVFVHESRKSLRPTNTTLITLHPSWLCGLCRQTEHLRLLAASYRVDHSCSRTGLGGDGMREQAPSALMPSAVTPAAAGLSSPSWTVYPGPTLKNLQPVPFSHHEREIKKYRRDDHEFC